MELGNYLLGKRTLLILPRFMRNEDYLPSLLKYLEKVGYNDDDIDIYPEIPLIINQKVKPTEIFLYEWVTHPRLLVNVLNLSPQILYVKYIADPHQISFGVKHIRLTNEMSDLYGALDHLSNEQKLMYGNHYFGSLPPDEIIDSLIEEPYELNYLGGNLESKLDRPLVSLRESHVPHPTRSIMHGRDLELDSPKITEIIRQFTINPGKYVIMTDFRGLYGSVILQRVLSSVFQANISVIDELTPCDVVNKIIDQFNQNRYDLLITCVVPHRKLIGVSNLIIFDHYNYNKIMGLLRVSYGKDLKVTFLAETHDELSTLASIKAKETIEAIRKHEATYLKLVETANSIMIKDQELYII